MTIPGDHTMDEETLQHTRPAQGSPAPDGMERAAPAGVSEQHPLLREKIRLAVLLFLVSEFIFFVFLIVAYVYSRQGELSGPTAHSSLVPWKDRPVYHRSTLQQRHHLPSGEEARAQSQGLCFVDVAHHHAWHGFPVWRNAGVRHPATA